MSDMLERAAKAIAKTLLWERPDDDDMRGPHGAADAARAALLAALDPEDLNAADCVGDAICEEFDRLMKEQGSWNGHDLARAAIAALKAHAAIYVSEGV